MIGNYTVSHSVLSKLVYESQMRKIEKGFSYIYDNVEVIERRICCYRHGGLHIYTSFTEKVLAENNFNVELKEISREDILGGLQALSRYGCNILPFGLVR